MNLSRSIAALMTVSFLAMLTACDVRVAGPPPPPPPPAGFVAVDVVGSDGYSHHGYWDEHHAWHGGWYDAHHNYHNDPPEWRR